ncbi:MAG: hypothetical protein ACYC7D_08160 [Nitrososphaerales archaeon]
MSSDAVPKWAADEIKNAKFSQEEEWEGSGYILDINNIEKKIDAQFYEKLPEGRYIATIDLPDSIAPESLELAVVYMFRFKALKAPLSEKVVAFLKEKFSLNMESLYKFELLSMVKLDDVSADKSAPTSGDDEEGDGESTD